MTAIKVINVNPQAVLAFWFETLRPEDWWKKSDQLDQAIREKFGALHEAASRGELYSWRTDTLGRLAEIIVLDQFSRNLYRNNARAFAQDAVALVLAQEAVAAGLDQQLPGTSHKVFMYMPYMHSESLKIHEKAVQLFDQPGMEYNLKFELEHKAIVERFGRYPHRNTVLGRESTREELAFLENEHSGY